MKLKKSYRATQGMNWIRQDKRLAIYLRDGCACVYCGEGIEQGATLSLDHLKTNRSGRASNDAENIVTACTADNSSRGAMPLQKWLDSLVDGKRIGKFIQKTTKRPIPMDEARKLIARRGSAKKALAHV